MIMSEYLHNLHDDALFAHLEAWHTEGLAEGRHDYLLVDMSMLTAINRKRVERRLGDGMDVLEHSAYAAYEELGPRLFQWPQPSDFALRTVLSVLNGLPALSMLEFQSQHVADAAMLAWLAEAHFEDGDQMYCRFADTRILPALLAVLAPAQHARLALHLRRWAWVGRDGTLIEHHFEEATKPALTAPEPLLIDSRQFSRLMQAAEADTLYPLLRERVPELIPSLAPARLHAHLDALLAAGRVKGVVDAPDQLQFVTIAWSSAEHFHELPVLEAEWTKMREQKLHFSELVAQWPDSVWSAIDALRTGE